MKKGHPDYFDSKEFTIQEKNKIIQVLQSQERVLTLLYDKTFPPRQQNPGLLSSLSEQVTQNDTLRKFNYQSSQMQGGQEEEPLSNLQTLEKETEEVMRC